MAYYKVRIEVWCDWNPADAISKKLSRTPVRMRPFVPSKKSLRSSIARKTSRMMKL